jgi:hypothetical protein
MTNRQITAVAATITGLLCAACPKPIPNPEPAGCDSKDTACVDEPHTEGPPPVGSNSPPPK